MRVTYRLIRPEEETAVLDLWAEALAENREELGRAWRIRGSQCLALTHVAVGSEGALVAASTATLREVHDGTSRVWRVGQLEHRAVRATARGQGYGGRLLAETVAALRRTGCAWAWTWAPPGLASFYTRRGWRVFGLPVCEGEPATGLPRHVSPHGVRL